MGLTTISMLVVHNLNEELCIFAPLYKDRLFSHKEKTIRLKTRTCETIFRI
jgi:hypothetical protein